MLARAALESILKEHKLDRTLAVFPTFRRSTCEYDVISTGHPRADQCLDGGWPRGHLSELCGPPGAGRTSLVLGSLAAVTAAGELAALVDAADCFDPVPAAAHGVVLERLLWVRGQVSGKGFAGSQVRRYASSGSEPERREPREHVNRRTHPYTDRALLQAVRSFDLVLRAGGFGLVVFDLAGVPERAIKRLPFTTWLRLGRSVEGSRTAALLITDRPAARSAGGVSLELTPAPARWRGQSDRARLYAGPAIAPRVRGFRKVTA